MGRRSSPPDRRLEHIDEYTRRCVEVGPSLTVSPRRLGNGHALGITPAGAETTSGSVGAKGTTRRCDADPKGNARLLCFLQLSGTQPMQRMGKIQQLEHFSKRLERRVTVPQFRIRAVICRSARESQSRSNPA